MAMCRLPLPEKVGLVNEPIDDIGRTVDEVMPGEGNAPKARPTCDEAVPNAAGLPPPV